MRWIEPEDPWIHLRTGDPEKGLELVRRAHDRQPTPSHIMELGVAYLWLQRYAAAWEHFRSTIDRYPTTMSGFYGMAGAAKWCLDDFGEAIRQWKAGLKASYSDTAGLGIRVPLLLFTAAVLKPLGGFERHAAERILEERSQDSRAERWPGPIAKWLVGLVSNTEFERRWEGDGQADTYDRRWSAEFYQAVSRGGRKENSAFQESMVKLSDVSRPEWSQPDFFLLRMWNEDFFIARHEAQRK
jgi:hypothetical protein